MKLTRNELAFVETVHAEPGVRISAIRDRGLLTAARTCVRLGLAHIRSDVYSLTERGRRMVGSEPKKHSKVPKVHLRGDRGCYLVRQGSVLTDDEIKVTCHYCRHKLNNLG